MSNKLSFSDLFDALSQGNERFRTIKGLDFEKSDIKEAVVSQNKYCIEFIALYKGNHVTVKVMIERDLERCADIIESMNCLEKLDLPLFAKVHVFPDELTLINDQSIASKVDIVIIEDTQVTLSDFDLDLQEDIIPLFAGVCVELLSRNMTLDLLSFDAFRYKKEQGVYLSPIPDFLCHTSDKGASVAFKNYLIMQLLYLMVNLLERERHDIYWEYGSIEVANHRRFDLRNVNYFLGDDYLTLIEDTLSLLEDHSDIDGDAIRDAVGTDKLSEAIRVMKSISAIHYSEEEEVTDYIANKNFDITGEHRENRVAIRNNKKDKFGYLDFDGDLVIDFLYDEASDFYENIAVCRKGELYGAIDQDGLEVSEFKYHSLEWNAEKNLFFWELNGEKDQASRRDFVKK